MLAFVLATHLLSGAPDDASLNALCTELSAEWQGGGDPTGTLGLGAAEIGVDPGQDDPAGGVWTCTYSRKLAANAPTWTGAVVIRIQDAARTVDATHLAIGVRELGWVHLGLLYDALPGLPIGGKIVRFEIADLFLGPEPEILIISEARDQSAFERTARLCVDKHGSLPAVCVGIPLAIGEGKRARRNAERLDLRLERDGRIALDQPRDRELHELAPLAGVHDLAELLALGRALGSCEEGVCLKAYTFDEPVAP